MKKIFIGLAIVITSTLFAAWPLFGQGFIPTHDGEYHIIRFMEFGRMMTQGNIFPRWAPTLNSGYGLPIFIFHYPFPNYIGVFLHALGLQYVNAFQVGMAIGYIGAAIGCFLWLRKLFGMRSAIIGTITAFFVPYWFVELYIRGTIGEVWAIFFLFFVLYCIEKRLKFFIVLGIAGMVMSHNIVAMVCMPFIFFYLYIRKNNLYCWILFGGLLSSYFWIPAIVEQRYVVGLNIVNFQEHFVSWYELLIPSWGSGFSGSVMTGNKMSSQIGVVSIVSSMICIFLLKKESDVKTKSLLAFFFICASIIVLLMLPISMPIWKLIPLLPFIQYPWRLLIFIIPITGIFVAFIVKRTRIPLGIGLALGAMILSYQYYHPVIYAPRNDAYYEGRKNFTDGTSSMGNTFSTIWTPWKEERAQTNITVKNGNVIQIGNNTYLSKVFVIEAMNNASVQIPILYYPGWISYVDGKQTPIDFSYDGTIVIAIPPGIHTVKTAFTETPLRWFADIISFVSFLVLIVWGILHIYANRNRHKPIAHRS